MDDYFVFLESQELAHTKTIRKDFKKSFITKPRSTVKER